MKAGSWLAMAVCGIGGLVLLGKMAHPSSCMRTQVARYDKNVIEYWNSCSESVHAMYCGRKVGTEFFSLFDGKDRQSCQKAVIGPKQMITTFYGSDENSSMLRFAVSDTHLWVATCYPPQWPSPLADGKYKCE